MRLRRSLVAAVLVAAGAGVFVARPAPAAQPCTAAGPALTALGLKAQAPAPGTGLVKWSGYVPSWDGLPLDVDLTLPANGDCPAPFVTFSHGWGGSKTDWEVATPSSSSPNKSNWNNTSFASRGYAVLNYSSRGWHGSCGPDRSADPLKSPVGLPAECTAGGRQYWVHLDDVRYEIRDTQWLIGRLVDAGVVDPARIGVTGGSYGGGVSWLTTVLNDRIACGGQGWSALNGTDPCAGKGSDVLVPWRSPAGTPLRITASVPEYTWASLALALMPNGRATDGRPGSPPSGDVTAPIGVPIESYVTGLYISGYEPPAVANGYYQPPTSTDDTANLPLWSALVQSGVNTVSASVPATKLIVDNAVHQLERYKSPLSPLLTVDAKVPVLQIQGSTDPLFPPIHAQLMWQKVKAFAPDYPIGVVYADVGHSYATNPSDVWAEFNQRGNAFFDHYLRGLGTPPVLGTGAMLTRCRPGSQGDALRTIDGPTLPGLAHDTFKASATTGGQTTNVPLGLEGLATDPIAAGGLPSAVPQPFGKGCRSMSATTDPGVVAWTFPVDRTITVAGQPLVKVTVQTTAPDVELAARLWDVAPDGSQTLISRGVYRLAGIPTAPAGPVAFQLSANAWRVPAGDKLKLEVAGADTPYYQVDAIPSVTNVSGATIEVPVAEGLPSTPAGSGSGPSTGAANAAAAPGQLPATGFPETRGVLVGGGLLLGALGLRRIKRRR